MKVPVYGDARVDSRPVATPLENPNGGDTGLGEVSQGLRRAGQGIERYQAARERARQRANDIDVNEQMAATVRDFDSAYYGAPDAMQNGQSVPGSWGLDVSGKAAPATAPLAQLKGKQAAKGSEQYFEYLDKRVQDRADAISDPDARDKYLARASVLVADYRRRAEEHVNQQIAVAEEASKRGVLETGMASIAGAYDDENAVRTQSELMMDAVRRSALSDEDAAGQITALNGAIGKLRISKYLADGNVDGAEAVYKRYEAHLGDAGDEIRKQITAARLDSDAEGIAERLSHHPEIADRDGRIDVDKALSVIDEHIPASDSKLRDEVKQRLVQRATAAERRYTEDTKAISSQAFAAYNEGGWRGIPTALKEQLNERNPELYHRLKEDSIQRWRRSRDDSAAARRAQAEANRVAYNDFMALPPDVRATTDIDQFLAGRGVDAVGKSALGPAQQQAKQAVERGDATHEEEFVQSARANAVGMLDKNSAKEFDAAARILFNEETRRLGRPPNHEESLGLINQLTRTEVDKKSFLGIDALWPDEELPGYQRIANEAKNARQTVDVSATQPDSAEPAAPAAPTAHSPGGAADTRLPAGRYRDRSGRVVIVDANGKKRFE